MPKMLGKPEYGQVATVKQEVFVANNMNNRTIDLNTSKVIAYRYRYAYFDIRNLFV